MTILKSKFKKNRKSKDEIFHKFYDKLSDI